MNAKIEDHFAAKRQPLHRIVPIDTPFSCSLEPTTYCNLKCNFCIHSLGMNAMQKAGHIFGQMNLDVFDEIVSQLKEFPTPIKTIAFVGCGEPLLHRQLPYMVEQLKKYNVTQNVIVVTNGIMLTKELSDQLINAGLDTMKISVNGLSSGDYNKTCGVEIDFEKFVSEITYVYQSKRNLKLMIKMLSSAVGEREELFYKIFGNICDVISIENTMPFYRGVSYESIIGEKEVFSRFQSVKRQVEVCAAPFFRMSVKFDGQAKFCGCHSGITTKNMNIRNQSLFETWHGEEHDQILKNVLQKRCEGITDYCNQCCSRNDFAFDEDFLDPYVPEIMDRIIAKRGK